MHKPPTLVWIFNHRKIETSRRDSVINSPDRRRRRSITSNNNVSARVAHEICFGLEKKKRFTGRNQDRDGREMRNSIWTNERTPLRLPPARKWMAPGPKNWQHHPSFFFFKIKVYVLLFFLLLQKCARLTFGENFKLSRNRKIRE